MSDKKVLNIVLDDYRKKVNYFARQVNKQFKNGEVIDAISISLNLIKLISASKNMYNVITEYREMEAKNLLDSIKDSK